jgi:hypothetical protein
MLTLLRVNVKLNLINWFSKQINIMNTIEKVFKNILNLKKSQIILKKQHFKLFSQFVK